MEDCMWSAIRWGVAAIVIAAALPAANLPVVGSPASEMAAEMTDPSPQPRTEPLSVMTFNIRYGTAEDGQNAWPTRRELLFEVIRDQAPIILGLQEALRSQLDELASRFDPYGEVGEGRDDGKQGGEYAAILYDKRRIDFIEGGSFWLSDTPDVPGSASWGNHVTRIVTWARFRDRADYRTFHVFNTHWDHESQNARERSAALLRQRIIARRPPDDPVLVMGDFNVGEDNPAFLALLGNGKNSGPADSAGQARFVLRDTFRAIHPEAGDVGTYHAFSGEDGGDKIDAILVTSEWTVRDAAIIHASRDGRYPSDHFPVTAILALGGK
jgi:endonuclease/exonuclease/phosphatase family metal-dependent hydrolase